jgi:hypothetical protein
LIKTFLVCTEFHLRRKFLQEKQQSHFRISSFIVSLTEGSKMSGKRVDIFLTSSAGLNRLGMPM